MQVYNKKGRCIIKQKSGSSKYKLFFMSLIFFAILFVNFIFINSLNNDSKRQSIEKTSEEDFSCKDCNVIIISITNLRKDHLGYNGYFRDTSPNIDKFAEKSIVFKNAFAQASWTLPSGISFFTSLYPFSHKIMNRKVGDYLDKDIISLPEILEENGYITAAFTGGFDYGEGYGFVTRFNNISSSGVNESLENYSKDSIIARYGNFDANLPKAIKWLEENKDQKFILFYQGYNTHCPFSYPIENKIYDQDYEGDINFSDCIWSFRRIEPIKIKNKSYYNLKTFYSSDRGIRSVRVDGRDIYHMVALYDGEIKNTDRLLKKFFEEIVNLDLYKNTIIILFSEHGDLFGEHGRFMRGGPLRGTFYDEVLHVPLIIKHPTLNPKKVDGLVQLVDIMPTVLDFLGIEKKWNFEGKSLIPLLMNNEEGNEYVLAGSKFTPRPKNPFFNKPSIIQTMRTKDFKLINERVYDKNNTLIVDSYEFYNLSVDPKETVNIYTSADSSLVFEFKKKLKEMEIK